MIEPLHANLTHSSADARRQNLLRWLAVAILPLAVVYLSMLNGYWVPSGDGEVYTCIARSLARGEGLMFNGSRAAIAPPGWPLVLAGAMKISPEFWFLKLLTTFSMLGALASAFFILRRFVTNRASAGIVLMTGLLSSVYPLTYWMHTEAFFCLLGFGAILIAFRVAEGRARLDWEVPLMLILLGFGAFTRWPGVLHLALVIPILLSGARQPWRRASTWVIIGLAVAVSIGTFRLTYNYLSLTKAEKALAMRSGGTSEGETDVEVIPDSMATTHPTTLPTTQAVKNATGDDDETPDLDDTFNQRKRSLVHEIIYRIGTSGKWFAWLLWQPTRFGQSVGVINTSALITGWLAIAMLVLTFIRGLRRHQYFWIGLAVYTGGLCVLWPNPNARYFVPVAPFIVLGILLGIQAMSELSRDDKRRSEAIDLDPDRAASRQSITTPAQYQISSIHVRALSIPAKVLMIAFVAATLLANLPLLAVDIGVFRSRDFYGQYEAGSNQSLMIAAQFINEHPAPGNVAVCELYDNMGKERWSKYGQRALHLLTDKIVITPPRKNDYKDRPTKDRPRIWAKKVGNDVEYYVYQSTWNPWRVWHFRLSFELQSKLAKRKPIPVESGGWELFERSGSNYIRRDLDAILKDPPTRVPGL